MTVYILAIDPPLAHAKHYVGWTAQKDHRPRLRYHLAGRGCRLIAAAVYQGHTITTVLTLPGAPRSIERKIKDHKNTPRLVARALRTGELFGYKIMRPRKQLPTR